jgi:hypothetical protein
MVNFGTKKEKIDFFPKYIFYGFIKIVDGCHLTSC